MARSVSQSEFAGSIATMAGLSSGLGRRRYHEARGSAHPRGMTAGLSPSMKAINELWSQVDSYDSFHSLTL